MADKTIGGCVRTPRPAPFDARPQHWRRRGKITDSPPKDGHTFPSRSSGRERKIILNGVEPSKEDSWQVNDNCKLSSRRQKD
ncbi:hypothetical protein AAG906_018922 [Vitis piasezkii]